LSVSAVLVTVLGTVALARGGVEHSISDLVQEQMAFDGLVLAGEEASLKAYLQDLTKPGRLRARALYECFNGVEPPLVERHRVLLGQMLDDPADEVVLAAMRLASESREESLLKQLLGFIEKDVDWRLKVQAIRSVRPWTRLTHMFFLGQALDSDSQDVLAEAVRSIGELRIHELAPSVVERITMFLEPENLPHLRSAALNALKGWGRVDWEMLRALILDDTAPESLRAYAIEMTDDLSEAVRMRPPVLMEIVERESSLPLMWRAFSRLRTIASSEADFIGGVAAFLGASPQLNVATKSMAVFLRSHSMAVSYNSGSWKVIKRQ
jgi:hypothetical protein